MDPNAALERISEALVELVDASEDLRDWLERGGFEPRWEDFPEASMHFKGSKP